MKDAILESKRDQPRRYSTKPFVVVKHAEGGTWKKKYAKKRRVCKCDRDAEGGRTWKKKYAKEKSM